MIKVRTEIEIKAPPSHVWQILTDFDRYGEWNPFIKTIAGNLQEGAKLTVQLGPPEEQGMTFKPRVTYLEAEKGFRWLGQLLIPRLMDGEHIFELEPLDENTTRFIHGEDYRGLLVTLFGRFVPDDGAINYIAMNKALKKRAEESFK